MALFPFNPELRRTPILRRMVPSLLKRWTKLTAPSGFCLARSHGLLFLLRRTDYVDRQVLFYDDYEAEQLAYLGRALASFGAEVFVDVGANFGFYSAIAARSWSISHVIAFEPDPRNFGRLQTSLYLNDLGGRVDAFNLALSETEGELAFASFPDTSSGQSRVVSEDPSALRVKAVRADDAIALSGRRIAVKIDVEGHELEVLRGMRRLLTDNHCLLQIESFGARADDVAAFLATVGYRKIHSIGSDHYFRRADAERKEGASAWDR